VKFSRISMMLLALVASKKSKLHPAMALVELVL
jgi:hypothetical protein